MIDKLKEWFPNDIGWFSCPNKIDVIEKVSNCTNIHAGSSGDYQGRQLFIFKRGDEFAVYIGYYGSCSGCDSWQAVDSYEELAEYLPRFDLDFGTKTQAEMEIKSVMDACGDWDSDYLDMYKKAISFLENYE